MHATCATVNQLLTNVVNMLECHFGGGHYKGVRASSMATTNGHGNQKLLGCQRG